MDPLSVTASIIAVLQLTEGVTSYLNSVRNASKEQQRIAIEASSLYSLVTSLRYRVESAHSSDPWFVQVRNLAEQNGPLEQFKSALESIAIKVQPGTGKPKAIRAMTWRFDKNKVDNALTKIEKLKTLINLALQGDHFVLSQAIHQDVGQLSRNMARLATGMSQMQLKAADENLTKIVHWLNVPDPSTNHCTAVKKRQSTTGTWFIMSNSFTKWKSGPRTFLWLHGIPGCGKTVLCSTIIEEIHQLHNSNGRGAICYFYFDFNDQSKRRLDNLVRSLLVQLAIQVDGGLGKLDLVYSSCHNGQRQPSEDVLLEVTYDLLVGLDDAYIIMDALDECQEREKLMELVETISGWHLECLHLLVTSRKERDIENTLESHVTKQVCLETAVVDADIQMYIRERLQSDPKLTKWGPDMQAEIEQALVEGAHGMFRWVVCQLDSIRKCLRPEGLRKTLKSLPKTLDETYTRILLSIEEDYREDAQRVLQWLCFSARPLRLQEVVEVLAIDQGDDLRFRPEERLPDPHDVLTICSSLVSLNKGTGGDDELRLAHFSVKEYLVSNRIPVVVATHINLDAGMAHFRMAQACLVYILYLCTKQQPTEVLFSGYPLARYGAEQWVGHLRTQTDTCSCESLDELILDLLSSNSGNLSRWLQLYDPDHPWNKPNFGVERIPGPELYYSSQAGLESITMKLLSMGADVNAQGGYYGNALQAASERGHEAIVKLLLDRGAEVNAQGGYYGNALQAASERGDEAIVKLLLNRGAEVNAQGGQYGNALHAASEGGDEAIVKLLMDRGAEVNAQDGFYGNALQAASARGDEAIVKLLLDRGAEVNVQGGLYGNALQAASERGHVAIVKLLLDRGAEVNAQGGQYGNALQAASWRGDETILKLLLDRGAEVNAQSGYYGNALQAASRGGHEATVKLLLGRGAEINAQGGQYGNALQAASERGHVASVKMLLDRGAEVNAQGGQYGNALQAAIDRGDEAIVKLLLDRGAKVNAQSGYYGNALQAASRGGHEATVKLLLGRGAEINAQGGQYGNALQAASERGHVASVKMLLDRGAEVNAQGGQYGNALQAAIDRGDEAIVKLLLDRGAEVNSLSRFYDTALQVALERGHEAIVKLLLDRGAEVNAQGGFYGNSL